MICPNCCLLSTEIVGFLSWVSLDLVVCGGTFWIKEVCLSVFYLLYWSILKISVDFLHLSSLVPVYKGPSIVFSLHPVFSFFFSQSFCKANKERDCAFWYSVISVFPSMSGFLIRASTHMQKGVFWRQGSGGVGNVHWHLKKEIEISISYSENSEAIIKQQERPVYSSINI